MLLSVRGGSFSFFIGISRFYTFLSVGERRRGIVGVFRAVPRTTLSEPPSQTVTYDKYAPVCLGGSSLFFIGISRFYTFLSVGERRRGIVGVFRAVPRTTLSETPLRAVTYDKYAPVCLGGVGVPKISALPSFGVDWAFFIGMRARSHLLILGLSVRPTILSRLTP